MGLYQQLMHMRRSPTARRPYQTHWEKCSELLRYLVPYHLTRTMHFSFLVAVAALAASMSVSAQ
ncbi:hypothetical protein K503DRAFT_870947, partial [Rhizopogon vinicolor AM-OR11-026]